MIPLPFSPQRILLIKPSALGDVVHTLPILRLVRRRFGGAHIAWLINAPFAGLIEGHPDLNEVIPFDRKRFSRSWHDPSAAGDLLAFARRLRDRAFDLVLDLQGLLRSASIAAMTRAPLRVGFANAREMAPLLYTHRVPVRNVEVHAIERYLSLVSALGCGGPVEFDFAISDAHRAAVRREAPYAVLLPGTNWPTKRWPGESFSALAQTLRERFGLEPVVAGAADTPAVAGAVDLSGKTSLKELVALLEGAEVVVANDTGPMHIAAALGRPLVALFGPTNPRRTGPFGRADTVVRLNVPCSPCYSRRCAHQSCLRWLTAGQVAAAVDRQLNGR